MDLPLILKMMPHLIPNVKQDDTFQLEPKSSVAETLFGTGRFFNEDFNAAVMLLLTSYYSTACFIKRRQARYGQLAIQAQA